MASSEEVNANGEKPTGADEVDVHAGDGTDSRRSSRRSSLNGEEIASAKKKPVGSVSFAANALAQGFGRAPSYHRSQSELETGNRAEGFLAEASENPHKEEEVTKVWNSRLRELPDVSAADLLSHLPHFKGCSRALIEQSAAQAGCLELNDGEAVALRDDGYLYVVAKGFVQFCVGMGPGTLAGRGTSFNSMGLLGLHREAECFKPRRTTIKDIFARKPEQQAKRNTSASAEQKYAVSGYTGVAPDIFEGSLADVADPGSPTSETGVPAADQLTPDQHCFYNLCMHACKKNETTKNSRCSSSSSVRPKPIGYLPLQVTGALDKEGYGPQLIRLPLTFFETLRQKHPTMTEHDVQMRKSIDNFRDNCKGHVDKWQTLMRHCSQDQEMLHAVPPDVVWSIAEISYKVSVDAGETLVTEGCRDEDSESIYVIEQGTATVEKLVFIKGKAESTPVGQLGKGAVIGYLPFLGASLPRAATVRANTRVDAVHIPVRGLLGIFAKYPGMLEACADPIVAVNEFVQQHLPTRVELLSCMQLFASCDLEFLSEVASFCTRQVYFSGQAVIEEGKEQRTLYVLTFGRCEVEIDGEGKVGELAMGQCFGVRTLLGISNTATRTVRVQTPSALMLAVPQDSLNKTLVRFPWEVDHFQRMKANPPDGAVPASQLQLIEILRDCSNEFCDDLGASVQSMCFMPGQTVVVQGVTTDPSMYVVVAGALIVESAGKQVTELRRGGTFGELMMLGLSQKRSCTVRAITFCAVAEIARPKFLQALEKHPKEKEHFQNIHKRQVAGRWPCLKKSPETVQYLFDLYADQRTARTDDETWKIDQAAVLVIHGQCEMPEEKDASYSVLSAGQCKNSHLMMGLCDDQPSITLKPMKNCSVKLVSKDTWDKVFAELPGQEEQCMEAVKAYCVEQAEEAHGFQAGNGHSLRLSAVFRALSAEIVAHLARHLVDRVYSPGSEIIRPQQPEHGLYIVLSGDVCVEDQRGEFRSADERVFGEAVMLGISNVYEYTVEALSLCSVHFLPKDAFEDAIEDSSLPKSDEMIYSQLVKEARTHARGDGKLQQGLQQCKTFNGSCPEFVAMISEGLESTFFAPGDVIFRYGAESVFGEAECYLLLSGQVNVESKLGVRLGTVKAVEVFGESAVPGTSASRTATVLAWETGLVYCGKIPGKTMAKAFNAFPAEQERLVTLFKSRMHANATIEHNRRVWLRETAVPALAKHPCFSSCCSKFLWAVATPLHEVVFENGKIIANAGDTARSMLIVLQGKVALESKTGDRLGVLSPAASVGYISMLGLLPTRTATLRAVGGEARVIEVTYAALKSALKSQYAGNIPDRFRLDVRNRQQQVKVGMPLGCLQIGTDAKNVSVAAIGIHSKRQIYQAGDTWQPLPGDHPNGPRFTLVANGRAILEAPNGRKVMSLIPGSVIIEGIAAEFGASLRAVTSPCEVYELFEYDFKIATSTVPSCQEWLWRFRLLEKEAKKEIFTRLRNMNGLIEMSSPHPCDEDIQAWRLRRQRSMRLANQRRNGDEVELPRLATPDSKAGSTELSPMTMEATSMELERPSTKEAADALLLHDQISNETHSFLSALAKKRAEKNARKKTPKASSTGKLPKYGGQPGSGLSAYPSFHLPFIQNGSPQRDQDARLPLRNSQSEPMLRRISDRESQHRKTS